ncbi:pentapeptide repeat-containing protein [Nucisporomicrobium flavum]|uniref:pentapeptide repeat-containing protein n=1 Tax=Nucisporomicrobium flavum TaxID=2785915 RepID=UPI003556268B
MRSADMRSADMRSADMRSADMRRAGMRSADMRSPVVALGAEPGRDVGVQLSAAARVHSRGAGAGAAVVPDSVGHVRVVRGSYSAYLRRRHARSGVAGTGWVCHPSVSLSVHASGPASGGFASGAVPI